MPSKSSPIGPEIAGKAKAGGTLMPWVDSQRLNQLEIDMTREGAEN